jgi:hypothetical protein
VLQFFTESGFEKRRLGANTVWFRPLDGLVASDTHGGNVLRTASGALVAIDVPLMRLASGMKALEPL